ncbi:GH25 family lysozyme [Furfurilactobacillus milii]|uniref:GH25 family lysozyme n=1 Tax=Furfurilactobacillus milii TaxID=2888272 RepID=UPI001F22012A|nr:GH25 family lysozyme [Furfurilactobacillus milii]MCF6419838.1 hypothetical protein [Furfurilactobacillus milii]
MANLFNDVAVFQRDDLAFFQELAAKGSKAVIIKLTQGNWYVNPKFVNQYNNAQAAGLRVHVYHYFTGQPNEAQWLIANIKSMGISGDPINILNDVEDPSLIWNPMFAVNLFTQQMIDAGYGADINWTYGPASWFKEGRLVKSQLTAKHIWPASYGTSQPGVDDAEAWQYTDNFGGISVDASYDFSGLLTSGQTQTTGKWVNGSRGWWYQNADGSYPTGWSQIDGQWFYFDSNGWMQIGWQLINGSWYLLDSSIDGHQGQMLTGWQFVNGHWYYLNDQGQLQAGWLSIDGNWYYSDPSSGAMLSWWQLINGNWYFLDSHGVMATGWYQVSDKWYLFDDQGHLLSNWQAVDGKWYYLDPTDGHMVTGWLQYQNQWYLLNNDGSMATGWASQPTWYHMDDNGVMQTGTQTIDGKQYELDDNGKMK